ncbi:tetratricopeptide repeat protein [Candidatus Nitrospira allomarina]|uniref:Tetratricopeptide repeat protein n=1 Tax=Candidatus Nitrospira allomarina TaxID=3020900 RepID=A0AA96JRK7_9BACT|nr:tetratricopeptide repeat protein [Candidatus Nitrospira allomarina]WNM57030.1 tetratricopeptide repeat protein [Candidatus Nitrospira allomarina]
MNRNIRSIFKMMWTTTLLIGLLSACTSHSKTPSPSSRTSLPAITGEAPTPALENQLLATVKHAEGLGPGNPLLLSSLYSLATYYEDRKEYDKSAAQYERALKLKETANGPNHPDVAAILQRYARMLQAANRPSEAANLRLRSEAILSRPSTPIPSQ